MTESSDFGNKKPSEAVERRREKRDALGIAVSLFSVTQSRVVLMVDASANGARISGLNLPGMGKDIILEVGDVELFGRIIRSAGEEGAVEFEHPINESVLKRLQKIVAEQTEVAILHSR